MPIKPMSYKADKFKKPSGGPSSSGDLQGVLRKMDPEMFRELLREHQWESGAIAIAILFIFLTITVVGGRLQTVSDMDREIVALADKKDPAAAHRKVLKERKDFFASAVKGLSKQEIVAFITDTAERRNILVSEFQPVTTRAGEYYATTEISFSCSVKSFVQVLLFLHDLETANVSMRVLGLNLRGSDQLSLAGARRSRQMDQPMEMGVKLSSMALLEK